MLAGEEAVLYDRQVRAFGTSKQQYLSSAAAVIELADYLLEELAKTCVILGFRTVLCIGRQRSKAFDLHALNIYCAVQIVSDPSAAVDALAEATARNRVDSVYLFFISSKAYTALQDTTIPGLFAGAPKLHFLSFSQRSIREFQIAANRAPDDTYALDVHYGLEDMYFLGDMAAYFLFMLMDAHSLPDTAPSVQTCTFRYSGTAWSMAYS